MHHLKSISIVLFILVSGFLSCLAQADTLTRTADILPAWPNGERYDAYALWVARSSGQYMVSIYLKQAGAVRAHWFGIDTPVKYDKVDYKWVNDHTAAFRLYALDTGDQAKFLISSTGPKSVVLSVDK